MFIRIISLLCVFTEIDSSKILGVFPVPSISHQVVFRPLMLELARRGHEVTVITTDPAYPKGQAPQNLTEIDVHDISYELWLKFFAIESEVVLNDRNMLLGLIFNLLLEIFVKQLKSSEVQNLFHRDEKFDLIFVESCVRPALIFSFIYKAPIIEFSSFSGVYGALETIGAVTHPLIYPNAMHRKIYNLTLWEKIREMYFHYSEKQIFLQHLYKENQVLKSIFGPNTPDLDDLRQNVQMLFLNVNPSWDCNRPVPPNVLYLGGLHQETQHELSEDLKLYLNSSINGVIYVSFGTNVKPSKFAPEILKIFTDVFSQLTYDVILKWDNDEFPGRPKNVKITKWLPQSDLLKHPKVKLFITQGGLQSTDEAIAAGVPLIGIPLIADQWFNVEQYVKFNIGKGLLIETLTEKQLMNDIKSVINDQRYRKNIDKLRRFMNDQPKPALERAVWWTEHVLRHGEVAYYRTPAANIQWTEYYEVQIILLALFSFITISSVTVLVIHSIISKVKCN